MDNGPTLLEMQLAFFAPDAAGALMAYRKLSVRQALEIKALKEELMEIRFENFYQSIYGPTVFEKFNGAYVEDKIREARMFWGGFDDGQEK